MNEKITIPLEMDAKKVKLLATELNDSQDSELSIFMEDILRKVNDETLKLEETAIQIMKENPFSQKLLKDGKVL